MLMKMKKKMNDVQRKEPLHTVNIVAAHKTYLNGVVYFSSSSSLQRLQKEKQQLKNEREREKHTHCVFFFFPFLSLSLLSLLLMSLASASCRDSSTSTHRRSIHRRLRLYRQRQTRRSFRRPDSYTSDRDDRESSCRLPSSQSE